MLQLAMFIFESNTYLNRKHHCKSLLKIDINKRIIYNIMLLYVCIYVYAI